MNNRTGIINQAHNFLVKFGIIFPVEYAALELVSALMENHGLPIRLRNAVERMLLDIQRLTRDIKAIDVKIKQRLSDDAAGIHLLSIPGIGPLTASALAASVGDAATRAHATLPLHSGWSLDSIQLGGKTSLLGIRKRDDKYLRCLPVQGDHTLIIRIDNRNDASPPEQGRLCAIQQNGKNRLGSISPRQELQRKKWFDLIELLPAFATIVMMINGRYLD